MYISQPMATPFAVRCLCGERPLPTFLIAITAVQRSLKGQETVREGAEGEDRRPDGLRQRRCRDDLVQRVEVGMHQGGLRERWVALRVIGHNVLPPQ